MVQAIWFLIHAIGVIVTVILISTIITRKKTQYLLSACFCCFVIILTRCISIYTQTEGGLLALGKMEYLGKCFVNCFALFFIMSYRKIKCPKWVIWGILGINDIAYLLIATADYHHLYYREFSLHQNAFGYSLIIKPAPFYYFYMAFMYVEMLAYVVICLQGWRKNRNNTNERKLYLTLAMMILPPSLLLLVYMMGWTFGLDTTPLGIVLAVLVMVLAVLKYGMFNTMEIAKDLVMERMSEGVVVVANNRELLYVNRMAREMFSQVDSDDTQMLEKLEQMPQGRLEINDRYFDVRSSMIKQADEIMGCVYTIIDMTELIHQNNTMRELKEKAEEANRAKSLFVSNISHEIRTPMNAIVGMTEILLRSDLKERERGYLENIQTSGNALLAIINDILDFSKMEAGKLELVEEDYEIMSIISDMSMMFQAKIGDKPIELLIDVDAELPKKMHGDPLRIRQIMINLLNNAVKYTEEGFVRLQIEVDCMKKESIGLRITVEDSGMGIREEDLRNLFGVFVQVNQEKTHYTEGNGLGLAITKQLVELMDGKIHVQSTYGKGSSFIVEVRQKVIDGNPAVCLNMSESEKERLIICSGLSGFRQESLEKSLTQLSLRCVDTQEIEKLKLTPDYFLIDAETFEQNPDYYKTLFPQETILCVLQNPYKHLVRDRAIRVMDLPMYSFALGCFLNGEVGTTEKNDENPIDFIAPEARILVVDDNAMNLKVAKGLLEPLRMHVECVESGKQAIELVQKREYDIIFMDHMMPEMDGLEATRRIRALPGGEDRIIIALSANAVTGAREAFLAAGMNDFVAKPIEMMQICTKIKQWLPQQKIVSKLADEDKEQESFQTPEEINLDEALKYCGDKELFFSIAEDFMQMIEEKAEVIEDYLAKEQYQSYTIEVHAMKSSSRMVGASKLADQFYELELLGKGKELDRMKERTPEVLKLFRSYKAVFERLLREA